MNASNSLRQLNSKFVLSTSYSIGLANLVKPARLDKVDETDVYYPRLIIIGNISMTRRVRFTQADYLCISIVASAVLAHLCDQFRFWAEPVKGPVAGKLCIATSLETQI